MDFTPSEISTYYEDRVPTLKRTAHREWRGPCPVHSGKDDNFTVDAETGFAFCHSRCGQGWDILSLEMALRSSSFSEAKAEVFRTLGRPDVPWNERDIEDTFDYTDADGKLLYQVVRRTGKKFQQRRPMPSGEWAWGLGGCERVPYRLPRVKAAEWVFIVEGEKDVHTIERIGQIATCNNGGAGNFAPELTPYFAGKNIIILPDNDEPGRKHALTVAALLAPAAASLKIVELPGLTQKGDVTDWLRIASNDAEKLSELIERAAPWTPEWEFSLDVPCEFDKYVRTLAQHIEAEGGLDKFWSLTYNDGVPTPWHRLTSVLSGGMIPGEIYVLGGNQGSGKTSLALQFAIAAIRSRRGVLVFSMEMDWRQVFQRMVSIEAKVDLRQMREWQREGYDVKDYRAKLDFVARELMAHSMSVHVRSGITPELLGEETIRLKKRSPIDLVVVDHMQLMAASGPARSEYEKFTHISRTLKQVAKEARVPVLIASQTSRRNSSDKRTELDCSDLRGSGAIEEDAAVVMLVYPDQQDMSDALLSKTFHTGPLKTWIKIGKNRYGPSGAYLPFTHTKTCTRFDIIEGKPDEAQSRL